MMRGGEHASSTRHYGCDASRIPRARECGNPTVMGSLYGCCSSVLVAVVAGDNHPETTSTPDGSGRVEQLRRQ